MPAPLGLETNYNDLFYWGGDNYRGGHFHFALLK